MSNESPICAACGGACCKRCPGMYSPEDFGAPDRSAMRERIAAGIQAGRVQIDWWEGDPRISGFASVMAPMVRCLFPRAPVAGDDPLFSPSWGGLCALLTPRGCELTFAERPAACRLLEPYVIPLWACMQPPQGDKQVMCCEWVAYQDVLESFECESDQAAEWWRFR